MKKLILCLLLIVPFSKSFSQMTLQDSLMKFNKVSLTQMYLFEVNRVVSKLPVVAFDTTMADIPSSKYVNKKFSSVLKRAEAYNKTLLEQYTEIIPYADRKNIVDAIIYLRGL